MARDPSGVRYRSEESEDCGRISADRRPASATKRPMSTGGNSGASSSEFSSEVESASFSEP